MSSGDWTALGTILLAVVTLAAVLTTIVITAGDRRGAAARLRDERAHSDRQMAAEREFTRNQAEEEWHAARDREQLAEAYAVQVVMGDENTGMLGESDADPLLVVVIVINHGRYTITGVEAQLRLSAGGSTSLVPFDRRYLMPGDAGLERGAGMDVRLARMQSDRLTRWDHGLRFETDPVGQAQLPGAYPVVRWADQWGTHWEHRRGEMRQIPAGEEWVP